MNPGFAFITRCSCTVANISTSGEPWIPWIPWIGTKNIGRLFDAESVFRSGEDSCTAGTTHIVNTYVSQIELVRPDKQDYLHTCGSNRTRAKVSFNLRTLQ